MLQQTWCGELHNDQQELGTFEKFVFVDPSPWGAEDGRADFIVHETIFFLYAEAFLFDDLLQ